MDVFFSQWKDIQYSYRNTVCDALGKVSQQSLAQSITLPMPACLFSIVHPGALCSPGKLRERTPPATVFHCFVVQFWCSHAYSWHFWWWTGVIMDTHTRMQYAAMQPHTQQTSVRCVFWQLFKIRTSINFFNYLSWSSKSVGSYHMGQPSVPTCLKEPWLPMITGSTLFLPWTTFARHWPLQTWNTQQEGALTQSSGHHNWGPFQTCSNPYASHFFSF